MSDSEQTFAYEFGDWVVEPHLSRIRRRLNVRNRPCRIVDRHDGEVRVLVSADQWKLYDDFKPGLIEQLEASLDIMRVR